MNIITLCVKILFKLHVEWRDIYRKNLFYLYFSEFCFVLFHFIFLNICGCIFAIKIVKSVKIDAFFRDLSF